MAWIYWWFIISVSGKRSNCRSWERLRWRWWWLGNGPATERQQTGRPNGCATIPGNAWWRHQMETFSALLAFCAGNSPVTGEFPTQRPVTRSFDVFFDQRLNKRLSKQWWGWWFETPLRSLWRHCNGIALPLDGARYPVGHCWGYYPGTLSCTRRQVSANHPEIWHSIL